MTHKTVLFLFFLSMPFVMASCARPQILVPAPSALIMGDEAVDFVKGVKVEVTGEGWKGNPGVYEKVTPLKITVNNINGPELRIGYSLFTLMDAEGNYYSALPPYAIKGRIGEETVYSDFTCEGMDVAPYYSDYYPNMEPYEGSFDYDPDYLDHYDGCLNDVILPTKEMVDVALPEGVLRKNSSLSGFLYFGKISRSKSYRFKMQLFDMGSRTLIGEIRIPLKLENKKQP